MSPDNDRGRPWQDGPNVSERTGQAYDDTASRARTIVDEMLIVDHPVLRRRVALVVPVIPEHAPSYIREGIARRRITAMTGQCPCGAALDVDERPPGQVGVADMRHERGCPAIFETLARAVRRWAR